MSAFHVTVRTQFSQVHRYLALGIDSATVHIAAIDRFGICAITVKPAKE